MGELRLAKTEFSSASGCVRALEEILQKAREGTVVAMLIVTLTTDGQDQLISVGVDHDMPHLLGEIEMAKQLIINSIVVDKE